MTVSRQVTSNQVDVHEDLLSTVDKHMASPFARPIPEVAQKVFNDCQARLSAVDRSIILDSGCGVGRSTEQLARQHPDHWVIGIDQSATRLSKAEQQHLPENMLLYRANLIDFWRLACAASWRLAKHKILFPNPWPKKQHLKRRWHGHPVLPDIVRLGGELELRTNWAIYAREFARALQHLEITVSEVEQYEPERFISHFEEKYHRSGQALFRFIADLP